MALAPAIAFSPSALGATLPEDGPEMPELEIHRVASLCAGMDIEVRLASGTRADCVSATHAIEVDYTRRWADAIGQSLHYAAELQMLPGMILVCHRDTSAQACAAHGARVRSTFEHWNIQMTVWWCDTDAVVLLDCVKEEFWGRD